MLSDAASSPGRESHAFVDLHDHTNDVLGVIVFGHTAGADGAGRIHFVGVTPRARLQGVASRLIKAAIADLSRENARFVFAELPDDPHIVAGRELLLRNEFVKEASIPDFYADGIALTFFRRETAR